MRNIYENVVFTVRRFYRGNLSQIYHFFRKNYNLILICKLHHVGVFIPPYVVKNGPSAISPSNPFVFITKFVLTPIRITLNSWETKILNLLILIFTIYGHIDLPLLMTQQLVFSRMRCRGDLL